jgi:hypothetical protein
MKPLQLLDLRIHSTLQLSAASVLCLASLAIKASKPWLNLQCLNPLGVSFVTSL